MKKHYETHVEDTDKLISVAGPVLDYKSWYEQYRKLMEEQAQRKYGLYTPTSEGDDDFPSISGMIARYSALGLTNEQMAANPVWVDKTGNGHDIQLKNFSWKGMSGVGGYGDENYQTFYKFTLDDYVFIATPPGVKHMNFTFRVTGLQPGNKLTLAFFGTTVTIYGTWNKDGIYTVDADIVETGKPTYFYNGYGATRGEFTIEILPLYPGALVFDGVDDYGVCDNFPILTKEKGYTVVALRQWLSFQDIGYPTLVVNSTDRLAAFSFEDFRNKTKSTWNWGKSVGLSDYKIPLLYTYQTSTSYNSKTISAGATEEGSNILQVCRSGFYCANAAIWEIVILDHDATEEELTKIKDYFVKTYPWLFPDQAWTVTGKTNEDEDRATIANITGNGNDLVLSNFGFAEGSGYGLYYQYFGNEFKATNGEIEGGGWNIIDNYNISHDKRIPINSIGKCFWGNKALVNGIKLRFKLTGMTEGDVLAFGYAATYNLTYTSDGIYAIDLPPADKPYGFSLQSSLTENLPTTPVTIELLPFEYEGYIVTDGVDDKITSSAFEMGKDFTIVGDWKFIIDENKGCGLVKVPKLFIYNSKTGLDIYINSNSIKNILSGIKGLNAVCSDGRVYDCNWNEISVKYDNMVDINDSFLIANSGNIFTKTAFKNLGIYNNQLLSKEDCIKAYNYLQTLKAK